MIDIPYVIVIIFFVNYLTKNFSKKNPRRFDREIFLSEQILFDKFVTTDSIAVAVYVESRCRKCFQRERTCSRAYLERYCIRRRVVSRCPIAADLQEVVIGKICNNVLAATVNKRIRAVATLECIVGGAAPERIVAVLSVEFVVAFAAD